MNNRDLAWLALNHIPGAGAVTLRRLASRFGSPEAALAAPAEDLVALGGLTSAQAQALKRLTADSDWVLRLADDLRQCGTELVSQESEAYPANLRMLRDAPPLLYVRGSLTADDDAAVAIVGTRTPSPAGAEVAHALARSLAARGVTIVSGLAVGVDGAAHRGALAAGRTIAVLGSGIDCISPRRHQGLAEEIMGAGALLSEVPPGTHASRETLLARNRIQAGLSKAVIVIQCRSRGGSFSTARRALQAGRAVFAVAWEEVEFAAGVIRLQQSGARAAGVSEILAAAAEAAFAPLPPQPNMSF
jgi:DNA processing protein